MLIIRALERGLTLRDFEILTIGMIMDIIITHNNDLYDDYEGMVAGQVSSNDGNVRMATQADFDRF